MRDKPYCLKSKYLCVISPSVDTVTEARSIGSENSRTVAFPVRGGLRLPLEDIGYLIKTSPEEKQTHFACHKPTSRAEESVR